MPLSCLPRLAACFVLLLPTLAFSQATLATEESNNTGAATTTTDGPPGVVPLTKGFNLSLNTTSQHDSSNGWSSLLNPNAAYRFNKNFSTDVTIPLYDYIVVDTPGGTMRAPTTVYTTKHFVAGDTVLNGHYQASPKLLDYELTASLGLPSGNDSYGLGAGQVTYQFTNSFEQSFSSSRPRSRSASATLPH